MSYIRFVQECEDCHQTWAAAFGIVGNAQIAAPPEECPHCGSTKIRTVPSDEGPKISIENFTGPKLIISAYAVSIGVMNDEPVFYVHEFIKGLPKPFVYGPVTESQTQPLIDELMKTAEAHLREAILAKRSQRPSL